MSLVDGLERERSKFEHFLMVEFSVLCRHEHSTLILPFESSFHKIDVPMFTFRFLVYGKYISA